MIGYRVEIGGTSKPFPVKTTTVTIKCVTYEGTYYVQRSTVPFNRHSGRKQPSSAGSPPEWIAKMLLSELVRASDSTD